jgi:hypothetical protein
MKLRNYSFIALSGLTLALGLTVLISQSAAAQCVDAAGSPVSCPPNNKKKRPTQTPVTALNPAPTATESTQPSGGQPAACQPSADQLASLCAALPGAGQPPSPNAGGNSGPSSNLPSPDIREGAQPHMFTLTELELGGGGGLLAGVLLGLLLPAIRGAISGNGKGAFGVNSKIDWGDRSGKIFDNIDGMNKKFQKADDNLQKADNNFQKADDNLQKADNNFQKADDNLGGDGIKGESFSNKFVKGEDGNITDGTIGNPGL